MTFLEPPNIVFPGTRALFTTKAFVGDIESIAKEFNIPEDKIYLPIQEHTDNIQVLGTDLKPKIADAVVTMRKGVLIGVQVADCVPVLLYDRAKNVIGAVHAGWRGTAKQVLKNTIKTMQKEFRSSAGDILIAIGPGIRKCCYETDRDVRDAVSKHGSGCCHDAGNGKYFVDLPDINKQQALSMGIRPDNIWQSDECTFCNPERFYSYRYTKGSTGRQGGFIGML